MTATIEKKALAKKSADHPDEVRPFKDGKGKLGVFTFGAQTMGRGSNSPRPMVWAPNVKTPNLPFPSLNGRTSSGWSADFFANAFFSMVAVMASPHKVKAGKPWYADEGCVLLAVTICRECRARPG